MMMLNLQIHLRNAHDDHSNYSYFITQREAIASSSTGNTLWRFLFLLLESTQSHSPGLYIAHTDSTLSKKNTLLRRPHSPTETT